MLIGVSPEQQRFVSEHIPIAALILAKAYVGAGNLIWTPFAVYSEQTVIGALALAAPLDHAQRYWLFHFFIDRKFQGSGYGGAAISALLTLIDSQHPNCRTLALRVHPDNFVAQKLYQKAGFVPTDEIVDGEPVYLLHRNRM